MEHQKDVHETQSPKKKPYTRPSLTTYGPVEKLTSGGPGSQSDFGGMLMGDPPPAVARRKPSTL